MIMANLSVYAKILDYESLDDHFSPIQQSMRDQKKKKKIRKDDTLI